jgi:hypothetical protein
MSPFETDILSDLIGRKRSCLAQLRAIGERQLDLVRHGSVSDLLELLAVKQHVLVQLQQIERELDRFRSEDPGERRWRSPEKRQECASQLAECEATLAQIMAQERQSEQELTRRRDEAAARLEEVHTASQARGAYQEESRVAMARLNLISDT